MRVLLVTAALVAVSAYSPQPKTGSEAKAPAPAPGAASAPAPAAAQPPADAPAGEYTLDPAHTSVNFRVSHMGLSHYTARFTRMTGKVAYDPASPGNQSVEATIDAGSLQTNY